MKTLMTILSVVIFSFSSLAQNAIDPTDADATQMQVVEVSCGQCNYGMKDAKGCDLAVKIDGKSYWVDGKTMADLGDPHAAGGLCTTTRKAEIVGAVNDGRFKASYIKLLPEEKVKTGHEGHNHN